MINYIINTLKKLVYYQNTQNQQIRRYEDNNLKKNQQKLTHIHKLPKKEYKRAYLHTNGVN